MIPYKEGDAPEFERDFCCWSRANCYMCPDSIFRNADILFKRALSLHLAGKPWVHLRPTNPFRTKWERENGS